MATICEPISKYFGEATFGLGQMRERLPRDSYLDLLRSLADSGRSIILVTHDRGIAERADRILVIDDGRVVPGAGSMRRIPGRTALRSEL